MTTKTHRISVSFWFILAAGGMAAAATPDAYGTSAVSYVRVPASAFYPVVSSETYSTDGFSWLRWTDAAGTLSAPVMLPAGAKVVSMRFEFSDTDAGGSLKASLLVCRYAELCSEHPEAGAGPADCVIEGRICSGNAFAAGTALQSADLTPDGITVDNLNVSYYVRIQPSDFDRKVAGVVIGYMLQVSPPPGSPTFGDVPAGDPRFQFVEALVASGVTAGCGSGNFCPDAPLTRGQMAVFLSKVLGLQWP